MAKSAKEMFIEEITGLIDQALDCQEMVFEGLSEPAAMYFEELKKPSNNKKSDLTDNGRKILDYMKEHEDKKFKAKEIAEALFMSSRSIAGSMRKLVTDGYVDKDSSDPINYSITETGMNK